MKSNITDNHFKILGVTKQSSKEEIKKAYRKLSMLWHPDKFSNDKVKWGEAHLKFINIKAAYELLKDYIPTNLKETQKTKESNFQTAPKTKTGKPDIIRIRVKSSNVFAIGYDSVNKILQVEFKNHSIYEYYDVSETVYNAFMNAESKGRFMGNLYKYKYRRV